MHLSYTVFSSCYLTVYSRHFNSTCFLSISPKLASLSHAALIYPPPYTADVYGAGADCHAWLGTACALFPCQVWPCSSLVYQGKDSLETTVAQSQLHSVCSMLLPAINAALTCAKLLHWNHSKPHFWVVLFCCYACLRWWSAEIFWNYFTGYIRKNFYTIVYVANMAYTLRKKGSK